MKSRKSVLNGCHYYVFIECLRTPTGHLGPVPVVVLDCTLPSGPPPPPPPPKELRPELRIIIVATCQRLELSEAATLPKDSESVWAGAEEKRLFKY
ncbi:hypothetical protein F2P81_002660 [Scophthalmus maximus]|uniref:Uncharacterized protein n=1 Tax=Scophthalmus maximus TaxID=52904 RepID=A0A6A4TTW2_SCOMX|nr:hypothetical protein F2P81_002660 [Scophthalmus maximus]